MNIEVGNGKYFCYVSFKYSLSQMKICSLHVNEVNNMDVRYEYFEDTDIEELVTFNNEKQILRDTLLSIKIGAKPLFKGVE